MSIELPELPFARHALAPHISSATVDYHYGKHHRGYVDKLNKAIDGTDLADADLETIIRHALQDETNASLFNNAAQVWNHTLYWQSMTPGGGNEPIGFLGTLIKESFGSYEKFREKFKAAGLGEFGSGWVWLVRTDHGLKIQSTTDAEVPTYKLDRILLTMDVWEHAYYLDRQNDRGAYIDTFLDHLVNWQNAADRLGAVDLRAAA